MTLRRHRLLDWWDFLGRVVKLFVLVTALMALGAASLALVVYVEFVGQSPYWTALDVVGIELTLCVAAVWFAGER